MKKYNILFDIKGSKGTLYTVTTTDPAAAYALLNNVSVVKNKAKRRGRPKGSKNKAKTAI